MDTSHTTNDASASGSTPTISEAQLGLPDIPAAYPERPTLAALRAEKNLTPEFVAASLRLSTAQIVALEQQNWARLPGPAYIKGFLRSYCKLLQIDAQPYLDQYLQSLPQSQAPTPAPQQAVPLAPAVAPSAVTAVLGDPQLPLAHFDEASEVNSQRKRVFLIAFVLLSATFIFLLIWERALWLTPLQAQMKQWFPAVSAVNAVSAPAQMGAVVVPELTPIPAKQALPTAAEASIAPANAAPADAAAAPAPGALAAQPQLQPQGEALQTLNTAKTANSKTVEIQFLDPVWLELRDKTGLAVITGMQKPGTAAKIKADAPLLLIVGASHAVKVKVEGNALDLEPHTAGNIAKVKIP